MLYVIGLGLSDERDITLKGLEVRPDRRRERRPAPHPCSSALELRATTELGTAEVAART
jgi:hypothetical protein